MLRTALVTAVAATALVQRGFRSIPRLDRDNARTGSLSCTDRQLRRRSRQRTARCARTPSAAPTRSTSTPDATAASACAAGIAATSWCAPASRPRPAPTPMRAAWWPACASTPRGGRVRADGPDTSGREESWSVSFELNVPRTAMLTLKTNNGGIAIDDFRGTADVPCKKRRPGADATSAAICGARRPTAA